MTLKKYIDSNYSKENNLYTPHIIYFILRYLFVDCVN